MTTAGVSALVAMALVALASAVIGSLGVRVARSTSDFLVASRTVGPAANAGAISGEYLSAASFLGVAGLILRDGVDALWYPVGFTAGYLALVLFVAAPLRRSGAYTVPDFAEARLGSPALRRVCTAFVLLIGWLYVLPQFQGAGLTVATVTGLPAWTGMLTAGVVVVGTVALGGMRSITFVQAFQYWLKLTAIALPAVIVVIFFLGDARDFSRPSSPQFLDRTTVDIRTDVQLEVRVPAELVATGTVDGIEVSGAALRWEPGLHAVEAGAELEFPAGDPVPVVAGTPADTEVWLTPYPDGPEQGLLATYSLIIATFLGTMGLPHVLVRFYTNPDGRTARRSAVVVLALLGAFYVTVTVLGALSRLYTPQLLVSGDTDAAVLLLPSAALGSGWLGVTLGALVAAGAWAAFLSTSSGLIVSVAGVLSTDVFRRRRVRDFRLSAVLAGIVPLGLALGVTRLDFSEAVALVFAVAASTFCPLLLLGIWWRDLTDRGAVAGMLAGGLLSTGAVAVSLAGLGDDGVLGVLLHRPAIISVPVAFLTMVGVSLLTRERRPADVDQVLLRLHAPERLGLSRDRLDERSRSGGR
ncbi:cation acetate symporter [Pseudonocardia sp.]|uniref:sodium/solute symporter n=1 Tax=Pseudonocardia sp. TaxID=60912 RepID=UPI002612D1C0|nr:cation acetate symporter [Pseudonocardia sp.]